MTDRITDSHDEAMVRPKEDVVGNGGPPDEAVESETTVSTLAHDLNNVLTTITTYADLLAILFEASPELDDVLEIKKAALLGAELTKKLTLLSSTSEHEALVDGGTAPGGSVP